jgi:hypothetical protein
MYSALDADCGAGEVVGAGTQPATRSPTARTKAVRIEGMVEEEVEALI